MSGSTPDRHVAQNVEQVILGIGQEIFSAIQRKDAESFSRFLADDFVHRSRDGSATGKTDFLRGISELPVEILSISGENEKVDVYGEVAVATGVQRAEWRQADGVEGISLGAFTDVFSRREGKWLLVLAYNVDLEN